jgi:Sec-independent protein translocase protein TatA
MKILKTSFIIWSFAITNTQYVRHRGGGELVFIMFIVLMLLSDKVPEMARTMGKAMAQLKMLLTIKAKYKKEQRPMVLMQNPYLI